MRTILYESPTGYRHIITHNGREIIDLTNTVLDSVNPESLQMEWQDHNIRSMDAPDWIPAGGVYKTINNVLTDVSCLYKNRINRNTLR